MGPYHTLIRKCWKPGLPISYIWFLYSLFSSSWLTPLLTYFSSSLSFLFWILTSPSSPFLLLVIISVQVVLTPFFCVPSHCLSSHHLALGWLSMSFITVVAIVGWLFSVISYNYGKFTLYTSASLIRWHSEGGLFPLMCFTQCLLLIMGTYIRLEWFHSVFACSVCCSLGCTP